MSSALAMILYPQEQEHDLDVSQIIDTDAYSMVETVSQNSDHPIWHMKTKKVNKWEYKICRIALFVCFLLFCVKNRMSSDFPHYNLRFKRSQKGTSFNLKLTFLSPFLEQNNLMRAGVKFSKPLKISYLLILNGVDENKASLKRYYHETNFHCFSPETFYPIRKRYFIIVEKDFVTKSQKMGDLPSDRFESAIPSAICGPDAFGNFPVVHAGRGDQRCWVLFVTYLITYVTALYLLKDMTLLIALKAPTKTPCPDSPKPKLDQDSRSDAATLSSAPVVSTFNPDPQNTVKNLKLKKDMPSIKSITVEVIENKKITLSEFAQLQEKDDDNSEMHKSQRLTSPAKFNKSFARQFDDSEEDDDDNDDKDDKKNDTFILVFSDGSGVQRHRGPSNQRQTTPSRTRLRSPKGPQLPHQTFPLKILHMLLFVAFTDSILHLLINYSVSKRIFVLVWLLYGLTPPFLMIENKNDFPFLFHSMKPLTWANNNHNDLERKHLTLVTKNNNGNVCFLDVRRLSDEAATDCVSALFPAISDGSDGHTAGAKEEEQWRVSRQGGGRGGAAAVENAEVRRLEEAKTVFDRKRLRRGSRDFRWTTRQTARNRMDRMERNGSNRTERTERIEQNGSERNGMEQNGSEWNGTDRNMWKIKLDQN